MVEAYLALGNIWDSIFILVPYSSCTAGSSAYEVYGNYLEESS